MEMYLKVLKNYAVFKGRARRKEYWMFGLIAMLIQFILGIVFGLTESTFMLVLLYIHAIAIILPSIAVTVRRLHDIGKSGWWYFISFVPVIGAIILFVFTCLNSQPNDNKYGANPKKDKSKMDVVI